MIEAIVPKFQNFRNHLFKLFPYRAGATMDLIDTVSSETNADSIVKLSLSELFRRRYSSLTDVLSNLFRTNLKRSPTLKQRTEITLKVTQLLAEECAPSHQEKDFVLFAIDCTANPRIYAKKVSDRTLVHAPNHVPGQKPITVGHEYSILVHLPSSPQDQQSHWAIPLSVKRVESNQYGPQIGLSQLEEISNATVFKDHFCVNVSDTAYSIREWVIGVSKWPQVIHIARMRSNRKVYRMPIPGHQRRKGRPLRYGKEILLKDPSQPDFEEITTITNRKGDLYQVCLERWNDILVQGSQDELTHELPFDLLRVTVTNKKGKQVYRRPLWLMITGKKRREISSKEAHACYIRRYDVEHFFRFGKQRLGLANAQTCETTHEENWYWIGILAYNMLYHARHLAQSILYPWEKRKIHIITTSQRPSQVQRDYGRIIRGIGTPAPMPKPRGKSPGRQLGCKRKARIDRPLVQKSRYKDLESSGQNLTSKMNKKRSTIKTKTNTGSSKNQQRRQTRIRRVWAKNRPPPTKV